MRSLLFLLLCAGVLSRLSLEPCREYPGATFAFGTDGTIKQGGSCLTGAGSGVSLSACDGSTSQQWDWKRDGTVECVGVSGKCLNVDGGGTAVGTDIMLYTCGHLSAPAKNGIFAQVGDHIYANESHLCAASSAPPAGACTDDMDCSLNGECRNSTCVCRAPWTSGDCGLLKMLPVPPLQGYGMKPNVTAWGGNVLKGEDGLFHLIVAEMVNGCPLSTWTHNSRCTHATSPTIQGPYTFESVAVGPWCHNPQVIKLPGGEGYALFHIGSGIPNDVKNCSTHDNFADYLQEAVTTPLEGSTIHTAASLNGPWVPLQPNSLPDCNNPSPFVATDGSIYVACGSTIYRATSIKGPWEKHGEVGHSGGPKGTYEDPYLYIDTAGYHVLYHVYNTHQDRSQCVNSTVSAHSYSKDGVTWRTGPQQPYTTQIKRTTGETTTVSTRERPKLFFDAGNNPTYLFNGVCSAEACPNGPTTGCVDCKYANWDYWLAQRLDV